MRLQIFTNFSPTNRQNFYAQNQLVTCGDPAIFTDHSLTEAVFVVRQEYNNLNNVDKSVTDPVGFNVVRDFCKKVQVIREASEAQKRGAADVAAALADVKPKVRLILSVSHLFLTETRIFIRKNQS